jgi:type II secretory pathway pseudopilin PulG
MAMLMAIVILGIMLSAAGSIWQLQAKREKEAELLFIGSQFRRALQSYYSAMPNQPAYPVSLEELLEDRRFNSPRRHLRRIYADPFTGKPEWGLSQLPDSRISGVYSLAEGVPLKQANFSRENPDFDGAESYQDWKFTIRPESAPQAGNASQPG